MMQKLNRWLENSHEARAGEREVELSEEERERLRALGYL